MNAPTPNPSGRFARFAAGAAADARLLLLVALTLEALRLFLLIRFRHNLADQTTGAELAQAFLTGLRYDLLAAFYVAAPGLLTTLLAGVVDTARAGRTVRRFMGSIFFGLLPLLAVVSMVYVEEYNDLFNHFVLGVLYDDMGAVAQTVWQQNPVILYALGAGAAGWLFARAYGWAMAHPSALARRAAAMRSPLAKAATVLLTLVFFAVAARGGVGRVPVQYRDRDATRDLFLNRMVLNPILAFRYAIRDHMKAMESGVLASPPKASDIRRALDLAYPLPVGVEGDVDRHLERVAPGHAGPTPRHIFLVVLESYDAWPFLPAFESLHLVDEGKGIGAEGFFFPAFISADSGTMTSMGPLMTGLAAANAHANFQASSRGGYASSVGSVFKKLGYRTRFFYGGRVSWQRIGEFAHDQGFDESYGEGNIPHAAQSNEWGVDDDTLFRFVEGTVKDDTPSFNLILSTGNHPPYNLDLTALGWTPRELPPEIAAMADGRLTDAIMGHLWFSDRSMGRFVRETAAAHAPSLFAVTGDHFSRKFLNAKPPLYESKAVPLLLYGPEVLAGVTPPPAMAGAHTDIVPTLVELAAPAGFVYHAVGGNLFDLGRIQLGFGNSALVTPGLIALQGEGEPPLPLPWLSGVEGADDLAALRERVKAIRLVSWWRVMRGSEIGK